MKGSNLRREILEEQADMEAERALVEPEWKLQAELFAPEQVAELSGASGRRSDFSALLDATSLHAVEALSGGIFTDLTNPANPWCAYTIEDHDLAGWYPVRSWLEAVSRIATATLSPSRSPFYAHAPQWFADMACFGPGVLFCEEADDFSSFIDRVIPLAECYFAYDVKDRLERVHRKFRLSKRKLVQKFPDLEGRAHDRQDYTVLHAVFPNPDYRPAAPGRLGMRWASVYLVMEIDDFERVGAYHDMPYQVVEWSRRGEKNYARGAAMRAVPDVLTLQTMQKAILTAANFAADPVKLSASEELVAITDIAPGAWLSGAISEAGKPLVQALPMGGEVRLTGEMAERYRQQIRDALYFSLMTLVNRPQMTATEVLGFQEERLRQMAPNLTRIQVTGLSPFLFRRFSLLQRAGRLPPPPQELVDQPLQVDYLSPMARAQKATRGRATLNLLQGTAQIAAFDPTVADNIDGDAAFRVLHDAFGADVAIMNDPRLVAQRRQARAAAQQKQADMNETGQAVTIAAEAAHAAQAQTLAGRRSAGAA